MLGVVISHAPGMSAARFADVERLFSRAPRSSRSGEPAPSNYAQLRSYVGRLHDGGEGLTDEFLELLRTALPHYEATGLEYSAAAVGNKASSRSAKRFA